MRDVFLLCFFSWTIVNGQDYRNINDLPKYDSRYDYLDINVIFESKRLVRNYVDCLVNIKPCTPEGKTLRKLLPEALRTKCARCTERQKQIAVHVIKRLKAEYPPEWYKLSSRWDPTGDFTRYFEVYLAKEEFNTIVDSGVTKPAPTPELITPAPTPELITPAPSPKPTMPPPSKPPTKPSPPPTEEPVITASTASAPSIENRFGEEEEEEDTTPRPFTTSRRPISPLTWPSTPPTRPSIVVWTPVVPTNIDATISTYSPYGTAATIIDQIGVKIIRTTEFVTDILKNTVKAFVG